MEERVGAPISARLVSEQDYQVPTSCPVSNGTPPPEDALLADEPQTRTDFLKYYCHLTLDPNTAYRELLLSEGNREAELTDLVQTYPEHPDRFSHLFQVLCKEGLTGRCYWEVEFKGSIEIAVAYKDLARSDYFNECAFGCNDKSWSLDLNKNHECFRHNDEETVVPEPQSSRVGVYLDHKAGILSFYCVSDTMLQLMHREETTFTQPLYPGLWIAGSAQLCDLE
ncbi:stonustoxin subunit alpha-like [Thunnus albacares]|uniref:stonustoxin subunit alpha-like n=1 Tax=Thunnus albacares TaxID=8236 RepID=UPI001CF6DAE3|nr:stonustoxin subunit alpha-like [Thunnus albacares]XP_044203412.1 stonustoxin subunit alpha-like [Thunnus albacares]